MEWAKRTPVNRRVSADPREITAFASMDEMLEPDVLASILGRPVESVKRRARTVHDSTTDATFESIYLDGEARPSLISKTVERDRDWVAIATHDRVDREVRTWESGILARLRHSAAHAVVAGARADSGYTVLMHDLSDRLLSNEPGSNVPVRQQQLVVDGLASMHATFWMDRRLADPSLGLATLSSFVSHLAPRTIERVRVRMGRAWITDWLEEGWDKLPSLMNPRLADDLRAIAEDPSLVVEAMSDLPWTLVHTDPRPGNLALDPNTGAVYLLDWARPALSPPALDLAYWLFTANGSSRAPREDLVRSYAAALERRLGSRFSSSWWEPQLDLCFVAFVACFVPIIANVNPDAVAGWTERSRPGMRALR
jgi:hypothetical protein